MERRKFLIGAGSTAIGASALVGSGAFSNVEANRTVSVETADDANAYLALTSASHYADDSGDTLELDFSSGNETDEGGQGLNQDATTGFIHVFTIENRGSNTVGIQIDNDDLSDELDPGHMDFYVGEQGGDTLSDYDREDMITEFGDGTYFDYSDDRVLDPGEELPVGLYFHNTGEDWDVTEDVTINALDEGTARHVA